MDVLVEGKNELVLIAVRVHPYPFRTRKLSSVEPKILGWRRPGKIGRCQHKARKHDVFPFFKRDDRKVVHNIDYGNTKKKGDPFLTCVSDVRSVIFLLSSVGRAHDC